MPQASYITEQKIKRVIDGAEAAGKTVTGMKIDGSAIELVFSDQKEAQEEETGLSLDWSRK